jgi:phosphoglycerate dehydrogenase-like enzyme
MKKKILVITPVSHIKNFKVEINNNFKATFKENINEKELIKIINRYEIIFTNPNMSKIFLSKKLIDRASKLETICTASTGQNHIDMNYAKRKKIKVISLRDKLETIKKISSTAEHSFALMMTSIRNIISAYDDVKKGNWKYLDHIGEQLNFLTIGVVGYGRLGKMFVKMIKPFTKKILIYDKYIRIDKKNLAYKTDLTNLLKKSDIISLHIHADKQNINFLDKKKFQKLKKKVLIINTSRGEIINEKDLLIFLKKNKESKYATDVIHHEIKDRKKNPIIKSLAKNNQILVTPHIGGMTYQAQKIAYNSALKLLIEEYEKK